MAEVALSLEGWEGMPQEKLPEQRCRYKAVQDRSSKEQTSSLCFHMGTNSREVKDLAASPGICQTEGTYVLHIIALLLSLSHAVAEGPVIPSRAGKSRSRRKGGLGPGLVYSLLQFRSAMVC